MAFAKLQGWLDDIRNDGDGNSSESDSHTESDIDGEVVVSERDDDSDESDMDAEAIGDVGPETEDSAWTNDLKYVNLEAFEEPTGPLHDLPPDARPIDYFNLFIPEEFMTRIVDQTNLYAEQCQRTTPDKYWKPVTLDDIRKFFYINIMFGIHNMPDYRLYWSTDLMLRVSAVADVMGRQRFEKIVQYVHLNDSSAMPTRGDDNFDPLYKIRPLLETVRSACSSVYKPSRHISVDEAMIKFNGRLHFKQYLPNKPTKWGIKVWSVAEAGTGYMLNFRFYTGKANDPMPHGVGHHVVLNTAADYLDKFHCIYFDNYFASVKLTEDLLKRNTYSCSTVRANRKGWPFAKTKKLKKGDLQMRQRGQTVATQWMDKRQVNILSTCSQPTMAEVTRKTKDGVVQHQVPSPVMDYNKHMGGVDLADQYRSYYPVGRPGRKWWRYGLWFLVQTAIINGFILMQAAHPKAPRRSPARSHLEFRLALLRDLLSGTAPRPSTSNPATPSVAGRVAPGTEHKPKRIPGRKKCCFQCSKNKVKTKTGRGVETVNGCLTCGIHLCKGYCFTQYHKN